MADESNRPTDGTDGGPSGMSSDAAASSEPSAPKRSLARRHWGKVTFALLLGIPLAVFGVWALISLNWSYSSGQRAGYVQKISRKGFVCKTWEGVLYTDIAKGFRSDSFSFTVPSDSLAHVIEGLSGKRVSMHYEQHIYVPSSCFGDTEYHVNRVDTIPE